MMAAIIQIILMLFTQLILAVFMTGVIWYVQLVHYPSFHHIEREHFSFYEAFHSRRTGYVVMFPMLFELILVVWTASTILLPTWANVVNITSVVVIWLSTFALQVPCHNKLLRGYNEQVVNRLVNTNWIRTICWSGRLAFLWLFIYSGSRFQ